MVTITARPDGTYQIESTAGPMFLVVTLDWLNELLRSMGDSGMLELNGQRITLPS